MKRNITVILLLVSMLTAGCSFSRSYEKPKPPIPAAWPTGAVYSPKLGDEAAAGAADLHWSAFWQDERLQWLIETALGNNRDLRLAALNVEKARALYGIQRSELFPSIGATGGMTRQRIPQDLSSSKKPTTQSQYSVNLGIASWEIDFFGRIRSLEEQALEVYLASEEARNSAQIAVVATVASAYLSLIADREMLTLARSTLETQKALFDLIQSRMDAGLGTEIDVQRAKSQVDVAQADVLRYTQQVAKDENALDLIVGQTVDRDLLAERLSGVKPPRSVAPGLSSEVLLLRPDIQAAEHRLLAANAQINAARAALFPRISLTTGFGTASAELSGLFGAGSATWLFSPQIVAPIFDARLWSAYDAAQIERELAVAQYEKAIQAAFREVADVLAVRGTIGDQLQTQKSLIQSVEKTYNLSETRYVQGLDSYLGVLDAQRSLYSARQGLVQLQLSDLLNQVQLYAVLGGGKDRTSDRLTPSLSQKD
ncbi:MAG: efflux transporter outer membrane subunit [Thermodesulfobacteriota bacterium]